MFATYSLLTAILRTQRRTNTCGSIYLLEGDACTYHVLMNTNKVSHYNTKVKYGLCLHSLIGEQFLDSCTWKMIYATLTELGHHSEEIYYFLFSFFNQQILCDLSR
jgi:hypothetical protein